MDATVYENKKIKGVATHALVIGVGHYGHLPGGNGQQAAENWGLRQLSSPPHSARALARWLIKEFKHPTKPLASVALLVAEKSVSKFSYRIKDHEKTVSVSNADMDNVKTAIEAWHARGNTDAENLLLFFFCGHGLALGPDLALLLSDFAENFLSPLAGALDFRRFRAGMNECAAREQCYFIDACRSDSELLSHNSGYAGNPVIQASGAYNTSDRLRQAPVFHSTLSGAASYATKKEPSHYTAALIEALAGAAAGNEYGPWQVRTALLHDALGAMMRDLSSRLSIPQNQINATDDLSTIDLNVLAKPWVPLVVTCDSELANGKAAFSCSGPAFNDKRRPRKGNWRLSVPVDSYDIGAKFREGPFKSALTTGFDARPIFRRVTLKVTR
jgi:hypothetical protein